MTNYEDQGTAYDSGVVGHELVGRKGPGLVHAGLPVSGCKPQSAEKVALVNSFKEAEERLLRSIEVALKREIDGRWAALAKTHFEQGFMALNRAVFQPGRVALPEDAKPAYDPEFSVEALGLENRIPKCFTQPDPTFKNEVLNDVDA